MARQIVLLVVFLALLAFANSIENKRETCRCKSESSKTEKSWIEIMDQENWVVDIVSQSVFNQWTNVLFEKYGSNDPYQELSKKYDAEFVRILYFTELTTKGLILNERWILIQLGCKTEERPQFHAKMYGDYKISPSYSNCPTDEIVISNRRVGSVSNKIRGLYAYGGPSSTFPERFRLIELESPIKLDGENPQTSFQPGCLLREHKEAKRTVYRNLSSSHRGEIVYEDVSDHPNSTLSEKLINPQYVRGNGVFEGGLRRNIPLHFEVEEQKFVVGLSSQLREHFDFRHYLRNGLMTGKTVDYGIGYTQSEYPVAPPFYRVSSYLDWIQSVIKEDICLFEQKDDLPFNLATHSDHTAGST